MVRCEMCDITECADIIMLSQMLSQSHTFYHKCRAAWHYNIKVLPAQFPGIDKRLNKEMTALAPAAVKVKVRLRTLGISMFEIILFSWNMYMRESLAFKIH